MKDPKFLDTPIAIGDVVLPNRIFYAPLAGCSDYPYRMMSSFYKPGIMFCEMVKMDAIVRNDPNTLQMLAYAEQMRPIGGQLCGSKVHLAGDAAQVIEGLGFDTIDLNCGCPVDKVTKDGSGSGLLRNPALIGQIVSAIVAAVKIPVTVKIRAGWDDESINAVEVAKIAYDNGAKALTIHGRTREQAYRGNANWDWIAQVKKEVPDLILVGNGDIFTPDDAFRIVEHTGCDAILVARGTMGQPWIADEIRRKCHGLDPLVYDIETKRALLLQHFRYMVAHLSEHAATVNMRRVGCWYFTKAPNTRAFREKMSRSKSLAEIEELVTTFPFEVPRYGSHDEPEEEEMACAL